MSAWRPAPLTDSTFNQLGQYANKPTSRAYCYTEISVSSLVVASTHYAHPRRDGQAELSEMTWSNKPLLLSLVAIFVKPLNFFWCYSWLMRVPQKKTWLATLSFCFEARNQRKNEDNSAQQHDLKNAPEINWTLDVTYTGAQQTSSDRRSEDPRKHWMVKDLHRVEISIVQNHNWQTRGDRSFFLMCVCVCVCVCVRACACMCACFILFLNYLKYSLYCLSFCIFLWAVVSAYGLSVLQNTFHTRSVFILYCLCSVK